MIHDGPSSQLYAELHSEVKASLASKRPILHHLNADTSWLLQIPRPEVAVRRTSRFYYNLLIDPWFVGGQSDLASWFSQQFHATASAIQSISALDELMCESERVAHSLHDKQRPSKINHDDGDSDDDVDPRPSYEHTFLDAVAISHEFTDHCHKATLLEIHPDVPVFAVHEAAVLIKTFTHFRNILTIPPFNAASDPDWRSTSLPPLPEWLSISRLIQTDDVLNYHSALMLAFNNHRLPSFKPASSDPDAAEAIIYTPHGISSPTLLSIPQASPPIKPLALLHGLHNVRVGTLRGYTALQSNYGAHNGLSAQRILKCPYWIGTHDEVKTGRGLVAWFLQRQELTVQQALEEERRLRAEGKGAQGKEVEEVLESFENVGWRDLGNGESLVLV